MSNHCVSYLVGILYPVAKLDIQSPSDHPNGSSPARSYDYPCCVQQLSNEKAKREIYQQLNLCTYTHNAREGVQEIRLIFSRPFSWITETYHCMYNFDIRQSIPLEICKLRIKSRLWVYDTSSFTTGKHQKLR